MIRKLLLTWKETNSKIFLGWFFGSLGASISLLTFSKNIFGIKEQLSAIIGISTFIIIYCLRFLFIFIKNSSTYRVNLPFEYKIRSVELDIIDSEGKLAIFYEYSQVKVLKENLNEIEDTFVADGGFQNFRTSNGFISSIRREEGSWRVITKFYKIFRLGESFSRNISCEYVNCYTNSREYFTTWDGFDGQFLSVNIIFPLNRPPRAILALLKNHHTQHQWKESVIQPITKTINGRVAVEYIPEKQKFGDVHKIEWDW